MRTFTNYSSDAYAKMLGDKARIAAYTGALDRLVTPETSVLDIGCGTGFFALYAARLGARRVVGIDDNEAVELAGVLAEKNGMAENVEFLKGLSTEIEFDERFDVIVSDLRGVLPLLGHSVASLNDARTRLLAPGGGGTLLPACDHIYIALAESASARSEALGADLLEDYGIDMRGAKPARRNWSSGSVHHDDLRSDPGLWAVLDYRTSVDPDVCGSVDLTATTDARVDGLAMWFDAVIYEELEFSNAPQRKGSVYGDVFLPVEDPFSVTAGATLQVDFESRLVGDQYIWTWAVAANEQSRSGIAKQTGTTAFAGLDSAAKLLRRREDFVAELAPEGEIARDVLASLDGEAELGSVARGLVDRFPYRWDSWQSALVDVADIAERYAR